MPKGGVLVLQTSHLHLDDPQRAQDGVTELAAGDYVMVSVQDNGTGIEPEVLARVFEPFFTTKPPSQGSGLGLSQVHGLAAQSGGAVRIASVPGAGTAVSLILPVARETVAAMPRTPVGDRRVVMVVDDDTGVRTLIGDMLSELGYKTILVSDPLTALEYFEQVQRIDILLADYSMPGMNGAELIDRATVLNSDLATVLVTGHADLPSLARDVADADLAKPFTLVTLIRALDAAQARQASRLDEERSAV
jgi:CheY-like chemotaxis protein